MLIPKRLCLVLSSRFAEAATGKARPPMVESGLAEIQAAILKYLFAFLATYFGNGTKGISHRPYGAVGL